MQTKKPAFRPKHGPEWHIGKALDQHLRKAGWHVSPTHGNAFQSGFPDRYLVHPEHGWRWVDYKASRYTFTTAQRILWPLWDRCGVGVWILTGLAEVPKLFGPPNWRDYWRPSWGDPDNPPSIDEAIREHFPCALSQ